MGEQIVSRCYLNPKTEQLKKKGRKDAMAIDGVRFGHVAFNVADVKKLILRDNYIGFYSLNIPK